MTRDEDHLRLLTIFHYVLAGLTAFVGCIPTIHLTVGIFLLAAPDDVFGSGNNPPPPGFRRTFGTFFVVIASMAILALWTLATCLFFSARSISRRTNHTFSLIIAAIMCLSVPLGTALGICTFVVLLRPSVQTLYEKNRQMQQMHSW